MLIADCSFSQSRSPTSLNFEHSIKRNPRPVLNIVFHFDLIDDVAFGQIFKRPAKMLRRDAEHGRAEATGIVQRDDLLSFGSEFLAHAVDQMDFRAHRKHRSGRRVADHLEQAFGGPNPIRFLTHFPAAFRMNNHLNSWIFRPDVIHVLRKKALVYRAMAFPQDRFCRAQALWRDTAIDHEWIPHDHIADRDSHGVTGIAAEMLVGEKQKFGRLGESPFECA